MSAKSTKSSRKSTAQPIQSTPPVELPSDDPVELEARGDALIEESERLYAEATRLYVAANKRKPEEPANEVPAESAEREPAEAGETCFIGQVNFEARDRDFLPEATLVAAQLAYEGIIDLWRNPVNPTADPGENFFMAVKLISRAMLKVNRDEEMLD